MICVVYSEIPKYLQDSAFFKALSDDDQDGQVDVPSDCYQADDIVQNAEQFTQLLKTVRFWGCDRFPASMFLFCQGHKNWKEPAVNILGIRGSYPLTAYMRNGRSIAPSIRTGHTELVDRWLQQNSPDSLGGRNAILQAVSFGDTALIQKLHDLGYPWNGKEARVAASCGDLAMLKILHQLGCPMSSSMMNAAAKAGHLHCMEYATILGCKWNRHVFRDAAHYGHLECLKYARLRGHPWEEDVTYEAANRGHFECLKYAVLNGCPIAGSACVQAAYRGDLDSLVLLHEHNAHWDEFVVSGAFKGGHVNTLRYALENGCPVDILDCAGIVANGNACKMCLEIWLKYINQTLEQ